jgi:erythromycin esterase
LLALCEQACGSLIMTLQFSEQSVMAKGSEESPTVDRYLNVELFDGRQGLGRAPSKVLKLAEIQFRWRTWLRGVALVWVGRTTRIALALALLSSGPAGAQLSGASAMDQSQFTRWAKSHLAPLSTSDADNGVSDVGDMLANAPVVALGEGVHLAAQPLEFRNRLFRHLVETQGFTAIAIESGIVESRDVHDYVRGAAGALDDVVRRGLTWTFDRLPQNRDLVEWLRAYNADPQHLHKVNFYGFDLPGSPSEPDANRGNDVALVECLKFLTRVDPQAVRKFHARLDRFLPRLRFYASGRPPTISYNSLTQTERDELTATIADLVTLLERNESPYVAATTVEDYQWAYRAALGARQVDGWLRQFPLHYRPGVTQARALIAAGDTRDRGMADNLQWIIEQEGPLGKVLIFAHTVHLSTAPVTFHWRSEKPAVDGATAEGRYEQEVAGTWLRRRLGNRLVTIGGFVGDGAVGYAGFQRQLLQPPESSIGWLLRKVGTPQFALDLRAAPDSVSDDLDKDRLLGPTEQAFGLNVGFSIELSRSFDLLVFFSQVAPAAPVR